MKKTYIIKRLFHTYTKKHIKFIILAGFLSLLVAASTAAIAWLLDPAIKKIFIEKNQTFIFLIPIAIIIAFASKGYSLFFARKLMIIASQDVTRDIQIDVLKSVNMEGTENLMPSELSGGMKKRVGIARAIVLNPEYLLYDEPTTGLDPIMSASINSLIKEISQCIYSFIQSSKFNSFINLSYER